MGDGAAGSRSRDAEAGSAEGRDGAPDGAADVPPEFVAAVFAQLDALVDVLQGLAWSPLSPGEVRATVRGLTALQGRVDAARLGGLVAVDARDDVVPKARAGQASVAFQQHAFGDRSRHRPAGLHHGAAARPGHR